MFLSFIFVKKIFNKYTKSELYKQISIKGSEIKNILLSLSHGMYEKDYSESWKLWDEINENIRSIFNIPDSAYI